MPWPALFAFGSFTAVFFGAPAVVKAITGKETTCTTAGCTANGGKWDAATGTCTS
ncbi:hypothetical protein [Wolbachia endosymbiont (group A) of Pogonocherus hispidulus]|uniref:hypothetical protein n=1 Tax=Wolbachia endosymbiont (group A) of Pogonocherus hispidulus TaxID=3066136 RepID=UPI00397A757F